MSWQVEEEEAGRQLGCTYTYAVLQSQQLKLMQQVAGAGQAQLAGAELQVLCLL